MPFPTPFWSHQVFQQWRQGPHKGLQYCHEPLCKGFLHALGGFAPVRWLNPPRLLSKHQGSLFFGIGAIQHVQIVGLLLFSNPLALESKGRFH